MAIVDVLDDDGKNEGQCMASLLIAWKFHSHTYDHTMAMFSRIAVPTRGAFAVGSALLRQAEHCVLKSLKWAIPAFTVHTAIPAVQKQYQQFVDRAIYHALRYVNQQAEVACLAWAVVHYACYISGALLQHSDFDIAPCSRPCEMMRVLHVLFKNDASVWNEAGCCPATT